MLLDSVGVAASGNETYLVTVLLVTKQESVRNDGSLSGQVLYSASHIEKENVLEELLVFSRLLQYVYGRSRDRGPYRGVGLNLTKFREVYNNRF